MRGLDIAYSTLILLIIQMTGGPFGKPLWRLVVEARTVGWVVRDGTVIDGGALQADTGSSVLTAWEAPAFVCNGTGGRRGIIVRNGATLKVDIGAMSRRLTNADGNITVVVESTRFETNASLFVVGYSPASGPPRVPLVEVFIRIVNSTFDNALLALVNLTDINVARWCVVIEGNLLMRNTMLPIPLPIAIGTSRFDTFSPLRDPSANMVLMSLTIADDRSTIVIQGNTFVSGNWRSDVVRCPANHIFSYGVFTWAIWVKNKGQFVFQDNIINVTSMPIHPTCNSNAFSFAFGNGLPLLVGGIRVERESYFRVTRNRVHSYAFSPRGSSTAYGFHFDKFDVFHRSHFLVLNNTVNVTAESPGNTAGVSAQTWCLFVSGLGGSCLHESSVQMNSNDLVALSTGGSSLWTFAVQLVGPTIFANNSYHAFSSNSFHSRGVSTSPLNGNTRPNGLAVRDVQLLQRSQAIYSSNTMTLTSAGLANQVQVFGFDLVGFNVSDGSWLQVTQNTLTGMLVGGSSPVQGFFVVHHDPRFDTGSVFRIANNTVVLNASGAGKVESYFFVSSKAAFALLNGSQLIMEQNVVVSDTIGARESRTFGLHVYTSSLLLLSDRSAFIVRNNDFTFNSVSTDFSGQQYGLWIGGPSNTVSSSSVFAFRGNRFRLSARSSAALYYSDVWGYSFNGNLTVSSSSALLFEGNQIWGQAANLVGHSQIYFYSISSVSRVNMEIQDNSSVIFENEWWNASSMAHGANHVSGFYLLPVQGSMSVTSNSLWLVRNTTLSAYAAGGGTGRNRCFYFNMGAFDLRIRGKSQFLFLRNVVSQFVTTAAGGAGIATQGSVFYSDAANIVVSGSSTWMMSNLTAQITTRGAATGNAVARSIVLDLSAAVTIEDQSQFSLDNSTFVLDAKCGYSSEVFLYRKQSTRNVTVANHSRMVVENVVLQAAAESLAAVGGAAQGRGFFFESASWLSIQNRSAFGFSGNTMLFTVYAFPSSGNGLISGAILSIIGSSLRVALDSRMLLRRNHVATTVSGGVSNDAFILGLGSLTLDSGALEVEGNSVLMSGGTPQSFVYTQSTSTLTVGAGGGAVVFDGNSVAGAVSNVWFTAPATGKFYYLRCNTKNATGVAVPWDLGLDDSFVAQNVTSGCTACLATFDCKLNSGWTSGAAPCTCNCSGSVGPVDSRCWANPFGLHTPETGSRGDFTSAASTSPTQPSLATALVATTKPCDVPPLNVVGTWTRSVPPTSSATTSLPTPTESRTISFSESLVDDRSITVTVKNVVYESGTGSKMIYSRLLPASSSSRDAVRAGTHLSLRYSLRRLPNETSAVLAISVSVAPSAAATVVLGSEVTFTSTESVMEREVTLVLVGAAAVALGNFDLMFSLRGSGAAEYRTPDAFPIRVEPPLAAQLTGTVPPVLAVGRQYVATVSLDRTPLPGLPVILSFTEVPYGLQVDPTTLEFRFPASSTEVQLVPLRRMSSLNLSFLVHGVGVGSKRLWLGAMNGVEVVSLTGSHSLSVAATPTLTDGRQIRAPYAVVPPTLSSSPRHPASSDPQPELGTPMVPSTSSGHPTAPMKASTACKGAVMSLPAGTMLTSSAAPLPRGMNPTPVGSTLTFSATAVSNVSLHVPGIGVTLLPIGAVVTPPDGATIGIPLGSVFQLPDSTIVTPPAGEVSVKLPASKGFAIVNGTAILLPLGAKADIPPWLPGGRLPSNTSLRVVLEGTCTLGGSSGTILGAWRITGSRPPLSPSSAPSTVTLTGTAVDTMPDRLLVGPCIVSIEVLNSTAARAQLCGGILWTDVAGGVVALPDGSKLQVVLDANAPNDGTVLAVTGRPDPDSALYLEWLVTNRGADLRALQETARKFVAAVSLRGSPSGSSEEISDDPGSPLTMCHGCEPSPMASPALFEWTAPYNVDLAPFLTFEVTYNGSVTLPAIIRGARPVDVLVRTVLISPLNKTMLDVEVKDLHPLRSGSDVTLTNTSFSATPLGTSFLKAEVSVVAPLLHTESALELHVEQRWGPRRFHERFVLQTRLPGLRIDMAQASRWNSTALDVGLTALGAPLRGVAVSLMAEAPVKVSLRSSSPQCFPRFLSLECDFPSLDPVSAVDDPSREKPSPSATIAVTVEAPSYYRAGKVIVFARARAVNLESEVVAVLVVGSLDDRNNGSSDSRDVVHDGAESSTGEVPASPGAFAGNVAPLGIFPQGGALACTESAALTSIIFVILFLGAVAYSWAQTPAPDFDTHADVPVLRSLLMKHGWLNLIPCHAECALIHVVQPFCHAMGLIAVCGLINLIAPPSVGGAAAFLSAVIIPGMIIGPVVQTLLSVYYWRWHEDIESFEADRRRRRSQRMKSILSSHLQARLSEVVLGNLDVLDSVELDPRLGVCPDSGEEGLFLESEHLECLKVEPGTLTPETGCLDWTGASSSQLRVSMNVGDEKTLQNDPQLSADANGTVLQLQREAVIIPSSEETQPETRSPPGRTDSNGMEMSEENADSVEDAAPRIIVAPYRLKGHLVTGAFATSMVVIAFVTISRFVTPQSCSAFHTSLLYCLALDFLVGQPMSVLVSLMYRWITSDGDNVLSSELHPIHHQRRISTRKEEESG